jgi:hypothetical protein
MLRLLGFEEGHACLLDRRSAARPENRHASAGREPWFVLMAIENSEHLETAVADPRRAFRGEETPAELATLLNDGLDRIIDAEDDPVGR